MRYLLFVSLCLWFPTAYKRWTHAFRLGKCAIDWEYNAAWETKPVSGIEEALAQPFTYLDKGAQSYVFISQDRRYVLKLFRFDACRVPFGQRAVRFARQFFGLREKHFLGFREKVEKNFASCKISVDLIPHLTGVVFAHLNPKPSSLPIICVRDRLGLSHKIDPANMRFVLQKTAHSFRKTLQESEDPTAFIASYVSLLQELAKLGVANLDCTMGKNFGFLDGCAIVIDIGNFAMDPELAEANVAHFTSALQTWLEKIR